MTTYRIILLFGLLASLINIAPVLGQTADEIIERYIEVIGGTEAIESIQTIRTTRISTHIEENRISVRTIYRKRPHQYREETRGDGLSLVNSDGAWRGEWNPDGTIRWREVSPPRGTDFEARIGWFINYKQKGYSLQYVDTEEINGVSMHHLHMTWADGATWDLYFDVSTGLFAMFKPTSWATVWVRDYRRVARVLFPHLTENRGISPSGQEIHHLNNIVSLEINVPLSDSLFASPINPDNH